MTTRDEQFMDEALAEARRSLAQDEFPVGAVVVLDDAIVAARGHWTGGASGRLLDHAEMLVLMEVEQSRRLPRRDRQAATLYTTLEPCALCMAAAMFFLLGRAVYGAEAAVDGGANLPEVWSPPDGHPPDGKPYTIPTVVGGVRRDASLSLIAEWVERDRYRRRWAARYLAPVQSRGRDVSGRAN
jgi:tRNA(Arg) A34 adenosine deaminase TadA